MELFHIPMYYAEGSKRPQWIEWEADMFCDADRLQHYELARTFWRQGPLRGSHKVNMWQFEEYEQDDGSVFIFYKNPEDESVYGCFAKGVLIERSTPETLWALMSV